MSLLAIETSGPQLGVALVEEARVLASYETLAERQHVIELPEAVTKVLKTSGQSLEQLDGIALDIGPGSFTGLRIGFAFVKALLFQIRKPLVGVSSLDVLAANVPLTPHRVCPLLDAKQRKVYAALYRPDGTGQVTKQSDYHLLTLEELLPMLQEGQTVFLGDGVALYREQLAQQLGARAIFLTPDLWLPRAATLGRLGLRRFRQGRHEDPRTLTPMYLYPMDCTVRAPKSAS